MYYVIQHNFHDQLKHFIAFKVPKYITNANNKNIIFEFETDGKIKRKWSNKEDIILLTDDPEIFARVLKQLTMIADRHKKVIQEAQNVLNQEIKAFASAMEDEFVNISHQKLENEVVDLLDDFR